MAIDIPKNIRQLEAIREKRRKLRNAAISSGLLFLLIILLPWIVILGILKMDSKDVPSWIITAIIVLGFGVLFPSIFVFAFWGTVENYYLSRRLKRTGQPMKGKITNVHSTGVRINHVRSAPHRDARNGRNYSSRNYNVSALLFRKRSHLSRRTREPRAQHRTASSAGVAVAP